MSLYLEASKASKVMLKTVKSGTDSFEDLACNIKTFAQRCYESLDPVVKMVLQNRGVSAIKNIYVAYDTEFTEVDYKKHMNKIVSYQLALNNKVFLRVPQPFNFLLGEKDPKSGAFRLQKNICMYELVLQSSINELCLKYREEFRAISDEFNKRLTDTLVDSGIENIDKNHYKVFGFARSATVHHLDYVDKGVMISSDELFNKCLELDKELGPSLT